MSNIRSQIIPKAQKSFIQYAFLRWETAVVIGGIALLWFFFPRPFPSWPKLGWPILGLLALGAVILSSLTDMQSRTRLQMELFQQSLKPSEILSTELRQQFTSALADLQRVELAMAKQPTGALKEALDRIAGVVADCSAGVFRVASRLDAYDHDPIQNQQREFVPRELETLRARLQYESNARARTQLESVMESKAKALEGLQALDARLTESRQRLRDSARSLGALCDRAAALTPQDLSSGQADQLERELNEELSRLNQLALALSETYVRL